MEKKLRNLGETQDNIFIKRNFNNENLNKSDVINSVNTIIETAILEKASDIHIKVDDVEKEIKFRIDGILRESSKLYTKISKNNLERNIIEIIARIKILSEMNVAEKRKPQDGSFSYIYNNEKFDIRSAYMPVLSGESIVLRILKSYLKDTNLETLGFSYKNCNLINEILSKKYGLILVSGPTGSGKSTTLLSMINLLNNGKRKIISVEDPVENRIKGITQIQVNEEIGVTFSEILKNCLRNDPDVIVISEIRDEITAEIAVRSALTGHLVIATIHTNDAISTLIRLTDMGVPKYLILDSLIGVIGQRLIGKICYNCNGELEEECNICNNGYDGRISINEVLIIDEKVKNVLKNENLGQEVEKILIKENKDKFISFKEDIEEKLSKKLISKKDVLGLY